MPLKKLLRFAAIGALGGLLAGCSGSQSFVKKGEIEKTIVQQPDQKRYVQTIGIGAADYPNEHHPAPRHLPRRRYRSGAV